MHVHCKVSNTGNVAGAEVVQCYYETLHASVVRPKKELVRFQKVFLDPGEKKNVDFYIDPKEFSYYECSFESVQETAATMNGEAVSYIFKYKEKEENDERL